MNNIGRICFLNIQLSSKFRSFESIRQIFSASSLGLVEFQDYRRRIRESIPNVDKFKEKYKYLCADKNTMIFLDDIQKMVTLTENKSDIKLVFKGLKKYTSQKTVLFNECAVGTNIMRLLHVMKEPMEAVNLVEDEETFTYFKNLTSCVLLLDMLFKNEEYEQVIRMFEYYQKKLLLENIVGYVRELLFAACYKLNTPESFTKALALKQEKYKIGKKLWCRSNLFFAALAVNQGQPLHAIETINDIQFNSLAENIRFMAYATANRFEDIFQSIRDILQSPNVSLFFVLEEVLFEIEKRAEHFSEDIIVELKKIKEELIIHNCYKNETLEKLLCAEVDLKLKKKKEVQKGIISDKQRNFHDGLKLDVHSL